LPGLSCLRPLGFEDASFDERDHATLAACALGTYHHRLVVTPSSFLEGVRAIVRVLDEPLADPALVPTILLARRARTEMKVVLVGEGGDELFAGDPTYVEVRSRNAMVACRRISVARSPPRRPRSALRWATRRCAHTPRRFLEAFTEGRRPGSRENLLRTS